MSKDPAFLFYPGDWLGGTMGMTFEQKGCYLELLIMQFNSGKFTETQAQHILSTCFASVWHSIKHKFSTDGSFFWNERLLEEVQKRKDFGESRRINALGKSTGSAHAEHKEDENEDETKNGKEIVFTLSELIKNRNPRFIIRNEREWLKDADKLLRLDKRELPEVLKVITWCQQDSFWQNNILSVSKLRIQYDQLLMKMGGGQKKSKYEIELDEHLARAK